MINRRGYLWSSLIFDVLFSKEIKNPLKWLHNLNRHKKVKKIFSDAFMTR